MNIFSLVRGKKNERETAYAGKVLLLFCCSVKRESDENELAFVRYLECLALLDKVNETMKCVFEITDSGL